jgi:predicted Zn-dependent protease with MMP-like domain
MQGDAFEAMVREMCQEIPPDYFDGITEVVVSPRAVPHPVHGDVFTLGECIPLAMAGEGPEAIQSRVVLYHGSFRALAEEAPDFDWREEAWQTLTHELRHHVEWRARRDDLEALDRAAEHNFARQRGDAFDPLFHLDGEAAAEGVYHVEDDWFLDREVRRVPPATEVRWHGRRYRVALPDQATLPAFVTLDGVRDPPPGELLLVLRRKARLRDLFRPPPPWLGEATVTPLEDD